MPSLVAPFSNVSTHEFVCVSLRCSRQIVPFILSDVKVMLFMDMRTICSQKIFLNHLFLPLWHRLNQLQL